MSVADVLNSVRLLGADWTPTDVLCRMVDALFFYVDQHCDVPGLKGTGVIEPAKYVWLMLMMGATQEAVCTRFDRSALNLPTTCASVPQGALVLDFIQSYYDLGQVPYDMVTSRIGTQTAVLDRRGWLHLHVFNARSDPSEAYKVSTIYNILFIRLRYLRVQDWACSIAQFGLQDPATGRALPLPLPRSCLPSFADPQLGRAVHDWKVQAVTSINQTRELARVQHAQAITNASLAAVMSRHPASVAPTYPAPSELNPFFTNQNIGGTTPVYAGYTDGRNDSGDHANMLDTTTAAIKLTNTILGGIADWT